MASEGGLEEGTKSDPRGLKHITITIYTSININMHLQEFWCKQAFEGNQKTHIYIYIYIYISDGSQEKEEE